MFIYQIHVWCHSYLYVPFEAASFFSKYHSAPFYLSEGSSPLQNICRHVSPSLCFFAYLLLSSPSLMHFSMLLAIFRKETLPYMKMYHKSPSFYQPTSFSLYRQAMRIADCFASQTLGRLDTYTLRQVNLYISIIKLLF